MSEITYELLGTVTGGAVSFTDIPSDYNHLVLTTHWVPTGGGNNLFIRLNNNSSSIYTIIGLGSDNQSIENIYNDPNQTGFQTQNPSRANQGHTVIYDFMNIQSSYHKKMFSWTSASGYRAEIVAGNFESTDTITSVDIPFAVNGTATFYLWGLK